MRHLFLSICILCSVGCQTAGYVIENSNFSIKQHRISIINTLGTPRNISENGRVIITPYHDRKFKNIDVTSKTKERLYTKVSVLGVRRPFTVSVEVRVERRDPETKKFQDVGLDDRLARKKAIEIKNSLHQSPEETGLFDEEHPF